MKLVTWQLGYLTYLEEKRKLVTWLLSDFKDNLISYLVTYKRDTWLLGHLVNL